MFSKTSLLNLAVLASSALALPAPDTAAADEKYVFLVSGFTTTCSASECFYDFSVKGTGKGDNGEPLFTAEGCRGRSLDFDFKPCSIFGIDVPGNFATKQERVGTWGVNVFVKLDYEANGNSYTVLGNETVPSNEGQAPIEFNVYESAIGATPNE